VVHAHVSAIFIFVLEGIFMRFSWTFGVRNSLLSALSLGLFLAAQPVLAKDTGAFVGASVGQTTYDICDDLNALGATSCDDKDTAYKVFGGYKFNPNLFLEGGYTDFGELTASGPGGSASAEADALFFSVAGAIPLGDRASVYGKVGLFFWDASLSATGFPDSSEDGNDLLFGAGASFDLTSQIGIRGEWERYDLDGDNVDMLSVGVQFMF
jgi:OOP family OmpA-OmpF porin